MKSPFTLSSFLIAVAALVYSTGFAQTNNVSSAPDPYCIGFTYTANAGGVGSNELEPGNDYGCLFSQPNPSWFFLKAEVAGTVEMNLYAPSDIDFIIYGPFSDMNEMLSMSGQLGVNPEAPEVDCSYSGTNSEYPAIYDMQVGDYYLMLVTNYASVVQDITIEQIGGDGSLDCTVFGEPFHHISGTAFYDLNQNGAMDSGEYTLSGVNVGVDPSGANLTTNASGNFNYIYFTPDTIDYTISGELEGWTNTSPDEIMFTLDTANSDTTGLVFGFFPDSLYNSYELDIVGLTSSCVLENAVWANISNTGTEMGNGIVSMTLDPDLIFQNANYPVDSVSGNTLYFSFTNLPPFNSLIIHVLAMPATWLTVGDTVTNYVSLQVDTNVYTDSVVNPVFCSYDPNNKIALPNGNLSTDGIVEPADKIEYIINFQNTGTAPAVNVKITDQLSSLLDEATFEFLSSSHPTFVTLDPLGNLIFDFVGINLPDSVSNEPMSKGYVKFRIALDAGVMPNDMVQNTANIYFDNNEPVITNTTLNVLSCFILPDPVVLSFADDVISADVSGTWYSYAWMLDGVPVPDGTIGAINCTVEGTYTLVVYNQYGCEASASYVYKPSTAGLANGEELTVSIYPNPSGSDFQVKFGAAGNYVLTVLDESGRMVFTDAVSNSTSYILKGDRLTQGVYHICVSDAAGASAVYRIVKL